MKLYSRVAFSGICSFEAKKNFLFWLIESITCSFVEIEDQVRLPLKLAPNYFTSLKINKYPTSIFAILPGVCF